MAAICLFAAASVAAGKPLTIMALGDSITEGGENFSSYRMRLWELLFGHGYVVEFVGSRSSDERIGALKHEGHSGKSAEFLNERIAELYTANPADVVLLHAGHNHSSEETDPVASIMEATRDIVAAVRRINPRVVILIAQPITSGKLPKYSYIPSLNESLAEFAEKDRLLQAEQGVRPVVLVDQATGFDWRDDTIEDRVHPNPQGAQKIANRWFEVLRKVLPAPPNKIPEPNRFVYRRVEGRELALHVFQPDSATVKPAPAVVYFFGGGWRFGTPIQFYRECARLAARGMVAIAVDYRIHATSQTTPIASVADAKAAMRWIRAHALELGCDPHRIAAAGSSAGAHLAAVLAFVIVPEDLNEPADSSRPDAMVLISAALDTSPDGFGADQFGERALEFSPLHHVSKPAPPVALFVGSKDPVLPVEKAELFRNRILAAGGTCQLFVYPEAGHQLWAYRSGENEISRDVDSKTASFFESLGWIRPTVP